jgi:hypothetical protein
MRSSIMGRYDGKPFLRLLDCYILKAIGHLDPQHNEGLRKMEPKLASIYGTALPWDRIVADQMEFPNTFPEEIRRAWDGYLTWSRQNGIAADPEEFVAKFMESNFPEIVA